MTRAWWPGMRTYREHALGVWCICLIDWFVWRYSFFLLTSSWRSYGNANPMVNSLCGKSDQTLTASKLGGYCSGCCQWYCQIPAISMSYIFYVNIYVGPFLGTTSLQYPQNQVRCAIFTSTSTKMRSLRETMQYLPQCLRCQLAEMM